MTYKQSTLFAFAFITILFAACKDEMPEGYETDNDVTERTDLAEEVEETSGLAYFGNALWTQEDSGNEPQLLKISSSEANIELAVTLDGATNMDWEDLAQDADDIYVGDFGNNAGNREDLVIYKVPQFALNQTQTSLVERIEFSYSDQTSFNNSPNGHNFDCEAMLEYEGNLYLFTKNNLNTETNVYKLPKEAGTHTAEFQRSFDSDGKITAADIEGNLIVLLGSNKTDDVFHPFVWLLSDWTGDDFFSGTTKRVDLGFTGQAEGIVHRSGNKFFISVEKENGTSGKLYLFDANKWL